MHVCVSVSVGVCVFFFLLVKGSTSAEKQFCLVIVQD